jgi:hypothetical protein
MNMDMNAPSYRYDGQGTAGRVEQALLDEGLRQHMLRVYNYMGLGLVMTGLVAVVVGATPALYVPIFSTPLKWVAILAPLPFAFFFAFRIQSISASAAQALFWAFCAVMGLSLASIFSLHRDKHRTHLFYRSGNVRRHEHLWLHDAPQSFRDRLLPYHGSDRRLDRGPREHLSRVERSSVRGVRCWYHRLRWTDRVAHAIDQGAVRRKLRRGIESEASRFWCLLALPELHQYLSVASEFYRGTGGVIS